MARCGAITEKGKRCRNRVADGRQWCHKHPRGRSGYLPVAKKRRRSSQRSVVVKAKKRRTRSSTPQLTAQRRRAERISHRAAKSAAVVDAQWSKAVLDQLDALVGLGTASDLRSADCAAMARVADQLLGGRRRRRGTGLFTLIFGPSRTDSLAGAICESLELLPDEADIATARAMQSTGMAVCRRAGVPLAECPCFQAPAGIEAERALLAIFRLAVGDWTSLIIPLDQLASP